MNIFGCQKLSVDKEHSIWYNGIKGGFMPFKKGVQFSKEHRDRLRNSQLKRFQNENIWNKGLHWADKIKKKISNSKKGKQKGSYNPNWKGGEIYRNGYIKILEHEHPHSNKKGYIKRSILVVEKKLGRYLKDNEIVHHKNGIKTDDRSSNLIVLGDSEHKSYHALRRKRNEWTQVFRTS